MYTTFRPHAALQGPQFAGKNNKRNALVLGLLASGINAATVPNNHANTGKGVDTFTPKYQRDANVPTHFPMVDDAPTIHVVDTPEDRQAREILQRPPFAPTDFNLFPNGTYPQSTNLPPAPQKPADEKAVLNTLKEAFNKRFNGNSKKVEQALNFYHNSTLAEIAPDPNLRGAITLLQGTLGKDAVKEILSKVDHIEFGKMPPGKEGAIALSLPSDPGAKKPIKILFNEETQGEHFPLLSSTLVHEPFHQDNINSKPEETIASYAEALTHIQLLAENPDLAQNGTKLSQRLNSKSMAVLNTRDGEPGGGNIHISGPSRNVYPGGGRELDNFGDFFNDPNTEIAGTEILPDTDGNTLLDHLVSLSTGQQENGLRFDDSTENKLNATQKTLSPSKLLDAIKALKLDIGPEPAAPPPSNTPDASTTTSAAATPSHTSPPPNGQGNNYTQPDGPPGHASKAPPSTSNAFRNRPGVPWRNKLWFLG